MIPVCPVLLLVTGYGAGVATMDVVVGRTTDSMVTPMRVPVTGVANDSTSSAVFVAMRFMKPVLGTEVEPPCGHRCQGIRKRSKPRRCRSLRSAPWLRDAALS